MFHKALIRGAFYMHTNTKGSSVVLREVPKNQELFIKTLASILILISRINETTIVPYNFLKIQIASIHLPYICGGSDWERDEWLLNRTKEDPQH